MFGARLEILLPIAIFSKTSQFCEKIHLKPVHPHWGYKVPWGQLISPDEALIWAPTMGACMDPTLVFIHYCFMLLSYINVGSNRGSK